MVIQVAVTKHKKTNYFMTTDEAKFLWQYSKRWSSKFQIMIGLALFRGMRIGEICACNLYDFQNSEFKKLNIIFEKSHIKDEFPILNEFNIMLKEYILKNKHTMKDGYLFPFYSSKNKSSHIHVNTAEALFSKLRRIIGKDHPSFLERTEILTITNRTIYRYRISFHSCRRWFETQIWKKYKDKMMLRDVMRYQDSSVVDVYIDSYEIWQKEQEILQNTFGELFDNFQSVSKGQTKLSEFV